MMAATVTMGAGLSKGYTDFTIGAFLYQVLHFQGYWLGEVLIRPGDTPPYLHS